VDEMTCLEVNEYAPEFALGILGPEVHNAVAVHLRACPACRLEVESMQSVGYQLLDLVPGTEPPLGFDRRVLSRVGSPLKPARRRFRMIATLAAAAVIAVAATIGTDLAGHTSHPAPVVASAVLYAGSQPVGHVDVRAGNPPWLVMTVHSVGDNNKVTCEVVGKDGTVTNVGTFWFEYGRGAWSTPDPALASGLAGVRLVDDHGDVVASAQFA
jgi:Putative zinc-finger